MNLYEFFIKDMFHYADPDFCLLRLLFSMLFMETALSLLNGLYQIADGALNYSYTRR